MYFITATFLTNKLTILLALLATVSCDVGDGTFKKYKVPKCNMVVVIPYGKPIDNSIDDNMCHYAKSKAKVKVSLSFYLHLPGTNI